MLHAGGRFRQVRGQGIATPRQHSSAAILVLISFDALLLLAMLSRRPHPESEGWPGSSRLPPHPPTRPPRPPGLYFAACGLFSSIVWPLVTNFITLRGRSTPGKSYLCLWLPPRADKLSGLLGVCWAVAIGFHSFLAVLCTAILFALSNKRWRLRTVHLLRGPSGQPSAGRRCVSCSLACGLSAFNDCSVVDQVGCCARQLQPPGRARHHRFDAHFPVLQPSFHHDVGGKLCTLAEYTPLTFLRLACRLHRAPPGSLDTSLSRERSWHYHDGRAAH